MRELTMLMRDTEIKAAVESGELIIDPFEPGKVQGASYDLALGGEALVSSSDKKILLAPNSSANLRLGAGDFALVLTKESVKFPDNIAGVIGMRSSLARKGLMLLAGMQIDPGFEGHLRFGLYNASPRRITLDYDDELCMIELHKLSGHVEKTVPPNPDLIQGRIPESDRDFLYSLETTSLSELGESVRELTKNVGMMSKVLFQFIVPLTLAILAGVITIVVSLFK
ncbi:MAG: dCTP deaminase [Planctomycetota bacterium]|nr:dCTP deaminase [Planctomycetota bacterium]